MTTPRPAERVLLLVVAQVFNAAVGFFFLPYLVRALTREQYGTYGQVLMVTDTVRTLLSLGISTVVAVRLASAREHWGQELKTLFGVAIAQGLVACLGIYATAGLVGGVFGSAQVTELLRIYCFCLPFYIPYLCLNAVMITTLRSRESLAVVSLGLLLRVVIIVVAVQGAHSLRAVFTGLVLLSVVQLGMAFVGVGSPARQKLREARFEMGTALTQLKLGVQLGITDLLGFLLFYVDDFMVSSLLSVGDYATYRNGTIEVPVVGTLYSSVGAITLPMVSSHCQNGEYDQVVRLKRKLIVSTAAVIYPIVFFLVLFSHPLVMAYFSSRYEASAGVFAIVSLGLLLRVTDYYDVLVSTGRARKLIGVYAATVALNVVLNRLLVPQFGVQGAAGVLLFSLAVQIPIFLWMSGRAIGRSAWEFLDLRKLVSVVVVSLALAGVARWAATGTLDGLPVGTRALGSLAYGGVAVGIAYVAFLKASILDYRDIASLVRKLPFGSGIDRRLKALFVREGVRA